MQKIYTARCEYYRNDLSTLKLTENDEEVLRKDKNYICTHSQIFSIGFIEYPRGEGEFYNSDDITENTKVEHSTDDYYDGLHEKFFLGFIYDDENGNFNDKKKLVRELVTKEAHSFILKSIQELIDQISKIQSFVLIGDKEK